MIMYIYKKIVTLPFPPSTVFNYLTTAANFPLWHKDVLVAGRASKKIGLGATMVQTIRILIPRKFSMHVTGFVNNRYFKIEALKGFVLLPGYSFSLKPVKGNATELTIYVQVECRGEKDQRKLISLYPLGGGHYWNLYVTLLESQLKELAKKAK
jgi:hypothetical protein